MTFTTDVKNVRRLQWHKHGGAYATASLRYWWHTGLGILTPLKDCTCNFVNC